jgi:hypothetical protein
MIELLRALDRECPDVFLMDYSYNKPADRSPWSLLDFDEKSQPTNAEEAVRLLLRDKPYLGGGARSQAQAPVATNANEGTTSSRPPNLTAAELEAAQDMGLSAERYSALKGVKTIEDWQATRRTQGQT